MCKTLENVKSVLSFASQIPVCYLLVRPCNGETNGSMNNSVHLHKVTQLARLDLDCEFKYDFQLNFWRIIKNYCI